MIPSRPPTEPPARNEPEQRPRPSERRTLAASLAIAFVVHVAVVLLYPLVMAHFTPDPDSVDLDERPGFRDVPEIVLFEAVPSLPEEPPEPEVEEEPEEPAEAEEPAEPAAPAEEDPATPTEEAEEVQEDEEEGLAPAERLRPRMGDARLWVPLDPDVGDLTPEERAELMIRGLLQDWNDSVAVAEALAAAARDWTVTDEEGRRWGVSPGRLHLGTFSVPLPFEFSAPGYRREEDAFRRWQWEDIRRGAATQEIRETWADRAREIRRRMDAQRADSLQIRN